MSKCISKHSECSSEDSKHDLKQISTELREFKLLIQQEYQVRKENNIERELQISLLKEEVKAPREERELRVPSNHPSRGSKSGEFTYAQDLGERKYYHQPSNIRRQRREHTCREVKVDLPYFYNKDNVKAYLDWEMKMEQLFFCHQVSEERKMPLTILRVQGYAMY